MGDEIEDPQKTLPGAVAWGGVLSGLLIYRSHAHAADRGQQDKTSACCKASCRRSGTWPARVGAAWIVAPFAFLLSLSIAGIGSAWLGGFGAHPFRCRTGFLHAGMARQNSSEICDALCRADRACRRVDDFGDHKFLLYRRWRAGDISEALVARRRSAACSFPLHVRRIAQDGLPKSDVSCAAATAEQRLLLAGASGLITTILGIALAFFPAPQITSSALLRNVDVRRHIAFRRTRRIFLFCLRPAQSRAKTRARPRRARL